MRIAYSAGERYLARRDRGARVELTTPEGIPLAFTIASVGERMNAFLIDVTFIGLAIVALVLLVSLAASAAGAGSGWSLAFALIALFLLRNFYFAWFEIRWQGSTPGKRMIGIRVIDAEGGPLTAAAVVGRNLTRDLEVFLPLTVLAVPEALIGDAPGWARVLSILWLIVFMLMPLFNKHRLRVGDMVAGTLVVLAPRAVLLEDIGGAAGRATYTFTREQLDVYGIYELQVLEDLLRRNGVAVDDALAVEAVARKIQQKIGWDGIASPVRDSRRFLEEFYAALRAHLEKRMLFGKRKESKHAR